MNAEEVPRPLLPWLGRACRQAREDRNVVQVKIAAAIEVNQATIARFEDGIAWPRQPEGVLMAYASELDMDVRLLWLHAFVLWLEHEPVLDKGSQEQIRGRAQAAQDLGGRVDRSRNFWRRKHRRPPSISPAVQKPPLSMQSGTFGSTSSKRCRVALPYPDEMREMGAPVGKGGEHMGNKRATDGTESRRTPTSSSPGIEPNPEPRRAPPNSRRGLRNRRSQVRIRSGA